VVCLFRYLTVSKDCLKDADGRSKPKQSADALALSSRVEKILLSNDVTRDAARRAMDGREIRDGRVYSIKKDKKVASLSKITVLLSPCRARRTSL
jgi:hypothetical protein